MPAESGPGAKFARALLSKVYVSVIMGALFYGGKRIDWPRPAVIVGEIAAAVAAALLAHFFVYWTRNLGDGIRFVEIGCRVALWFGLVAAAALWMVADPGVGVLLGMILLYMAGNTWREALTRAFRWARFENVALRRDDPDYRPATVPTLWPPRR